MPPCYMITDNACVTTLRRRSRHGSSTAGSCATRHPPRSSDSTTSCLQAGGTGRQVEIGTSWGMEAKVEMERAAGNLGSRPGKVGTNPEFMGMERETGLEPATPCLEEAVCLHPHL